MISSAKRTISIGGTSLSRETVKGSVDDWTSEMVANTLRETALSITQQQVSLGNEPSLIQVDNNNFKKITEAEKKVIVLFGIGLAHAVIAAVEQALIAAIELSTNKHTGALSSISNWEWILVPGAGKGRAGPVNPYTLKSLSIDDRLILRPKISYATAVNANVAGGRRSISFKMGAKAAANERLARRNTGQGFFGAAANLIRRNPSVRGTFSVYAAFTRKHLAPGEVSTAGKGGPKQTGQIVFRPKRRGRL